MGYQRFLADFVTPGRSLLRFIVGTAALTVLVQLIYDLARAGLGFWGSAGVVGSLILLILLIVVIELRRERSLRLALEEGSIRPRRGLILLVSSENRAVLEQAVRAHAGTLRHCWLLATAGNSQASQTSRAAAAEFYNFLESQHPEVQVYYGPDYEVDPFELTSTWQVVDGIFTGRAQELGLREVDLIADITGGTKPMTAGAALACGAPDRDMQYMQVSRDSNGEPVPGAELVPVQFNTLAIRA